MSIYGYFSPKYHHGYELWPQRFVKFCHNENRILDKSQILHSPGSSEVERAMCIVVCVSSILTEQIFVLMKNSYTEQKKCCAQAGSNHRPGDENFRSQQPELGSDF